MSPDVLLFEPEWIFVSDYFLIGCIMFVLDGCYCHSIPQQYIHLANA